jgi:large conductance mechanosensitive channel
MWNEFRAFIRRGNVVDIAVGISVGTAFTALVKSFVDNLIMPPLALLLGYVDFTDRYLVLREGPTPGPYVTLSASNAAGALTWRYGLFLNALVSFLITALAFFVLIKAFSKMAEARKSAPPPTPPPPTAKSCPYCLGDVPLAATRCPHCTSHLPPPSEG